MNSTVPSDPGGPILCPLDSRRSSKEVYLKLFVVIFTTLGFYFHLVRRRDGKYLGWSPLLYLLAPLNTVFRYLLGVLGIFFLYGLKVLYSYLKDGKNSVTRDTYITPLRWLFGKAPVDGYSRLPTSDRRLDSNDHDSNYQLTLEKVYKVVKMIPKTLLIGAFITQCAGSIVLYNRRLHRDAVTMIDSRVFEFACGGLVVGVLTLSLSFKLPIFNRPIPDGEKSKTDRFALFCRDSCREQLLAFDTFDESYPHLLRFLKNAIITLIMSLVFDPDLIATFGNVLSRRSSSDEKSTNEFLVVVAILICPFGAVMPWAIYNGSKRKGDVRTRWRYRLLLFLLSPLSAILLYVFSIVFGLYGFIGLVYAVGYKWTLYYVYALIQVSDLSRTPQNVTCPMLWSDPASEWIWGLA